MRRCILCKREDVAPDDAVVGHRTLPICICLRCYERVTGSGLSMDRKYMLKIIEAAGKE